MTSNAFKLSEFMVLSIKCEYCGMTAQYGGGLDCDDAVTDLDAYGWRVTKTGKVKCPVCVQKSKRKNK